LADSTRPETPEYVLRSLVSAENKMWLTLPSLLATKLRFWPDRANRRLHRTALGF
jgi:hypothetical protein